MNTLQSFGIREVGELPERYVNLLLSLPLLELEDDYVFVHAGLAFNSQNPLNDSQPQNMLWYESGVPDRKLAGREGHGDRAQVPSVAADRGVPCSPTGYSSTTAPSPAWFPSWETSWRWTLTVKS